MKRKIAKAKKPHSPISKKKAPRPAFDTLPEDAVTEILDAALTSAETHLQTLMPALKPSEVLAGFVSHVQFHLVEELTNIADHGHRNDDAEDIPERPDLPHDANCTYRLSGGISECSCNKDSRPDAELRAASFAEAKRVASRGPANTDLNHMLDADGEKCLYCEQSSTLIDQDQPCPARTQASHTPGPWDYDIILDICT